MSKKLTTEEFIEKAKEIHGDKYDYSKVEYRGVDTKVCIICPEHGEFWQIPYNHINKKQGCPKCGQLKTHASQTSTLDAFVEKAKKIHGDKYDYSKVEYKNATTKVCIICPEHGEFWQTPNNHLSGNGCKKCSMPNSGISTEEFIAKAREIHGNKYDYSKTVYKDTKTKVCIICPEHGEFWQLPTNHLKGHGCDKCAHTENKKTLTKTTEDFIKRAREVHGKKYDYSKTNYVNSKTSVCIICPEHGEFWQLPSTHLNGGGCSKCKYENIGMTKDEFIKKANEVHGNKYDYSKVDFKYQKDKVCIICPEHGEFWQRVYCHLKGQGCQKCIKQVYDTESFITKARKVHGDKYDYSKVKYVKSSQKVCIVCPEHGEFWQTPNDHLSGNGCNKCRGNYNMTTEEFIVKAREIHGDKYDYSKTVYKDSKTKVCIICPEHGEFWQQPNLHLSGSGCKKCNGNFDMTTEEFIAKAREVHGDVYDYSKVDYVNVSTKVCIVCPKHGVFWVLPNVHLKGHKCQKCAIEESRMTTEEFIEKARKVHGSKYDYSKVEYVDCETKVCIICPEHGEFWQTPRIHLDGKGCVQCNNSQLEETISTLLGDKNIFFETEKTFNWLIYNGRMRIDFFIPEKKIAVECQGLQHFQPIEYFGGDNSYSETVKRDTLKRQLCEEHGIKVLYYSDLGIEYPYQVYEDKEELLKAIMSE